jgi:hypothetical protein
MIGECQLTPEGISRVLRGLHDELPQQYGRFQPFRHPEDERLFFFFDAFGDGNLMHTFTFHIDDCTSPDHLLVTDLEHSARPL